MEVVVDIDDGERLEDHFVRALPGVLAWISTSLPHVDRKGVALDRSVDLSKFSDDDANQS